MTLKFYVLQIHHKYRAKVQPAEYFLGLQTGFSKNQFHLYIDNQAISIFASPHFFWFWGIFGYFGGE